MDIISHLIAPKFNAIDIPTAIDYAVGKNKEQLEDLNTLQLDTGSDTEGKSLGSYRSIAYKGRLTPVDLKDTGAFRKGLKVKSVKGVIEMDSTDKKTVKLAEKYGDDIVGIPRKDIESGEVGEILIEDIIFAIRKQISSV